MRSQVRFIVTLAWEDIDREAGLAYYRQFSPIARDKASEVAMGALLMRQIAVQIGTRAVHEQRCTKSL